jgi:hypothetical protein
MTEGGFQAAESGLSMKEKEHDCAQTTGSECRLIYATGFEYLPLAQNMSP